MSTGTAFVYWDKGVASVKGAGLCRPMAPYSFLRLYRNLPEKTYTTLHPSRCGQPSQKGNAKVEFLALVEPVQRLRFSASSYLV